MRDRKLWLIAISVELVLMAIGLYLEWTKATLGEAMLPALTQLPGTYLSVLLLPEVMPPFWLYVLTFVFQTVFFSMVLHLGQFVVKKLRTPRE